MNHNKEPSKSTESSNEEVTKNEENISHHVAKDIVGLSEGLATCNIRCNIESKNEDGGGSMPKILELWDEMKKQNEDLKKQLQEQNAVLSSLQQTMTSSKTYSQSEENPTIDIHSSNIIKKNPKKTSTKTLENKQKQAVRNNKSKESMTTTDMSKQKKPQVKTKRPNVTAAAASMNEKKRIREDTNKSHKEKIKEVESPQIDEKEKKSSEKVLKTKERQKSIPSQAKEITNNGVNEEKIGTIVVAVEKKEMASLEEIMKDTNSKNNQIMVNEHSIDGNEELPLGEEGSTFVPYPEEEAGGAEEEGELKSSSSFSLGNTESCFIPIDDNNPFFK
jgi:hypothetical protein